MLHLMCYVSTAVIKWLEMAWDIYSEGVRRVTCLAFLKTKHAPLSSLDSRDSNMRYVSLFLLSSNNDFPKDDNWINDINSQWHLA